MSARWRIAVLGPGRVGRAVALGLARAGHRVVAASDGGGGSAAALAAALPGLRVADGPTAAVALADLVLVTVPDDAVVDVVTAVARADGWGTDHHVVHCAGALGTDALRRAALAGAHVAAVHPARSVPSGAGHEDLVGSAWAVTATPGERGWAHRLVTDLGGDPFDLAAGARVLYHAGLVLGANGAAGAVVAARQLLHAARVPEPGRVLAPLVAGATGNALATGATALTGPVVRGDLGTVRAHLSALDADLPELASAYRRLQQVVLGHVRPALDPATHAELAALLAAPATGAGAVAAAGPPPVPEDVEVRPARPDDDDALWDVLAPVLREGRTYLVDPATGRDAALAWWTGAPHEVLVAVHDGAVVGTCYVQPNAAGGGAHVANAGFATAPAARGRGVARALCHAALGHARAAGSTAMQFNAVVAGNVRAVALWRAFGFAVVGRVPDGFRHPDGTPDDLLVLHRRL